MTHPGTHAGYEPVADADVYVVVGDPDGHVHVYRDEYRAGLLAVGYVAANLDGGLYPLTDADWSTRRAMVERLVARHSGRVIDHEVVEHG